MQVRPNAAFNPLALLTPGGSTITAPLLKMICSSQTKLLYRIENDLLIGFPGGDNYVPDAERLNISFA